MGNTFLTHNKCGGPVVLDASPTAKLIAPSFSINSKGIGSLTLDIQIAPGGKLEPAFWCMKCGNTIDKNIMGSDLVATCQVCGTSQTVDKLNVHSHITTICDTCLESIIAFTKSGAHCPEYIEDYVANYNLTSRIRVVPLTQVLNSPITI
jgi:hypothetical protein